MSTLVYHGGTDAIPHPSCTIGRERLDFGQGFYLTELKQQAERWALFTASRRGQPPLLNVYQLDKQELLAQARCRVFTAYDVEWLDFIVLSRRGLDPAEPYDYIEGGVADDRVIDTVNLYMAGLIDAEGALQRLAQHRPNNQICLRRQALTDRFLHYVRTEPVG